ncbi:hypothetical protein IIA15_09165 [candidate division TA06 bacterium]|nr:hypothetical protein [candidate division TA06 bacterium]
MESKPFEKKKFIILLILFVIIIVVWSRVLLKQRRRSSTPPVAVAKKAIPQKKEERPRQLRRFQKEEWGRNPFLAIGEERETSYLSGLVLTGILWDEKQPFAVINGAVLGAQDAVGHYTIREILPDGIVLERDGKTFTLRLGLEKD